MGDFFSMYICVYTMSQDIPIDNFIYLGFFTRHPNKKLHISKFGERSEENRQMIPFAIVMALMVGPLT
jgi:hypothetical protein